MLCTAARSTVVQRATLLVMETNTIPDSGDTVATPEATSVDVPTPSRHVFTMTVEDAASILFQAGFEREERTIQRWCSSGKLKAIKDHASGDRYLIDPHSVDDMVATLVAERERQEAARRRASAKSSRHEFERRDSVAPEPELARTNKPDTSPTKDDMSGEDATASETDADSVATLREQLKELERELVSAKIDAEARKQVIAQMGESYKEAIDYALERSERVGRLEAENDQLRQMLPAPEAPQEPLFEPGQFTPNPHYPQPGEEERGV